MGAAILEQQEQQEKVAYKESFPTTPMLILVPYGVDPDQLASQKLADLDLHS